MSSSACAWRASARPPSMRSGGRAYDCRAKRRACGAERPGHDEHVTRQRARPARDTRASPECGDGDDHRVCGSRVAADDGDAGLGDPLVQRDHVGDLKPGTASVTSSASGVAPEAARSLRLTAAARKPRSRQPIQSRRKWTPSTSASCVTTRPSPSCAASCSTPTISPRRSSSAEPAAHRSPKAASTALLTFGSIAARIVATPAAPAAMQSPAFDASMPPIATTGTGTARQIARRPSSPIGGSASVFDGVSHTGPAPR